MRIFNHSQEISNYLNSLEQEVTLGFVPTMGALHDGHAALIKRAVKENDITICSIFVNPLQFNRKEDLETYPDRMDSDIAILEKHNCDVLFRPSAADIYQDEVRIDYNFGTIGKGMEAEYRPGHFEGVAEVIHRFFQVLHPHKAYFGEKDYQQLAIVRWLVETYNHSTKIVGCETIRDQSGLAMSSRNYNLTEEQYSMASEIYKTLAFCKENRHQYNPDELSTICLQKLQMNFRPEYFTIADQYSMVPLKEWRDSAHPRAFVAAYCDAVRLIDNLSLT